MILPDQLDKVLERLYTSVWKQDGTGSLDLMQAAFDRHLEEKGCSFSIIKDREFFNSRKVLEGKLSQGMKVKENYQISQEA